MKQLLENDFLKHYGVTSTVAIDCLSITDVDFDLDDEGSPISLKTLGKGKASFHNDKGELEIVHYEDFINQCAKPRSFKKGRKKCDYLLYHTTTPKTVVLLEITSALGSRANLEKPITHKTTDKPLYEGGKFEKCEDQLFQSLSTLVEVPSISGKLNEYTKRICLMAYTIKPVQTWSQLIFSRPFARYLAIEAKETPGEGASIECPRIEGLGFEHRRIEHPYVFDPHWSLGNLSFFLLEKAQRAFKWLVLHGCLCRLRKAFHYTLLSKKSNNQYVFKL